jgi:AcrR family transcriptional regulator
MAPVKGKRAYDSTLRKQQAAQTRSRILDAAEALFAERGYPSTTIEAIATSAGVSPDTVYSVFGSKSGVLHKLLDVRVGGDDSPTALLERPGPQSVRAEPDPRRQLAAFASDVTGILERARPVDDIMRSAAVVDPEVASLRSHMQAERHRNMRSLVGWLARKARFRRALSEEEVAAVIWTLASPEVHRLLRTERHWSRQTYSDWLGDTLTRALLD